MTSRNIVIKQLPKSWRVDYHKRPSHQYTTYEIFYTFEEATRFVEELLGN